MSLSEEMIAKKYDKEHALKELELIMADVNYEVVALTQDALLKASINRIPTLSHILEKVNDSGEKIAKIGERVSHFFRASTVGAVGRGFHIGIVVLAGLDFFRIPIIYLSAYILNQAVPLTLENNTKWLYAAGIMALSITALMVPAIAPVIGFVIAGFSLSVTVFALSKALYERYQMGKEHKKLKKEMASEEGEMKLIQEEAYRLNEILKNASDEDSIIKIYEEIALIKERYDQQKKILEELKSDEFHLQQKIEQIGILHILDKGVGVLLGAATIIGLSLSLFFPFIGLVLLAGTAIAAGVYFLGRITAPSIQSFGKWLISKIKNSSETETAEDKLAREPSLSEAKDHQEGIELDKTRDKVTKQSGNSSLTVPNDKDKIHESTSDVLIGLLGEKSVETLKVNQELPINKEEGIAGEILIEPTSINANKQTLKEEPPKEESKNVPKDEEESESRGDIEGRQLH